MEVNLHKERLGTDLLRNKKVQATLDSREVAEMMDLKHDKLIRKIDGINKDFTDTKIGVSKYWVEGTYKDVSGKANRNFQITKRGCEFLAHKTTGTKGNLFTDKYMDKFEMMEEILKQPKTAFDLLELQFQALKEVKTQLNQVNYHALKASKELDDFKEDIPLFNIECDELQTVVRKKGVQVLGSKGSTAYKDKSLRTKVYSDIQRQIKREFGLNSYKAIKRGQLEIAKNIVNEYKAPTVLAEEILRINNQISFERSENYGL